MTLIEAAKQALEALESFREISDFTPAQAVHAITALRTAIEQAEKQEPVAWKDTTYGNLHHQNFGGCIPLYTNPASAASVQKPVAWLLNVDIVNYQGQSEYRTVLAFRPDPAVTGNYEVNEVISAQPLYTTPPAAQRQPLTDDEIDEIWNRYCDEMGEASINDAYDIARAIEASHGIKDGT